MVALLVPGIGEENLYAVQASPGDTVPDHLHGIVSEDADVIQPLILECMEQAADAGSVDLDANEISLRLHARHCQQRLAHPEADFENQRRAPAEHTLERHPTRFVIQPPSLPASLECPGLGRCHAPGAQHIAANMTPRGGVFRRLFHCADLAARGQ